MEKFLYENGLTSSTVEALKKEGFESVDDLFLLDDWSFSKLNCSLKQTLLLRNIVKHFKGHGLEEEWSISPRSTDRFHYLNQRHHIDSKDYIDSQYIFPETPEANQSNYFNFNEDMWPNGNILSPRDNQNSYWPDSKTGQIWLSGYDDDAATHDLVSEGETPATHMDAQSMSSEQHVHDMTDAHDSSTRYYSTLPSSFLKTRSRNNTTNDDIAIKQKSASLEKSSARYNKVLDFPLDYATKRPPVSLLHHQYAYLFDKAKPQIQADSLSDSEASKRNSSQSNTGFIHKNVETNSPISKSHFDSLQNGRSVFEMSEGELIERRRQFRERYKTREPQTLTREELRKQSIAELRDIMSKKSQRGPSTISQRKNQKQPLEFSSRNSKDLNEELLSPRLPGSGRSNTSSSIRDRSGYSTLSKEDLKKQSIAELREIMSNKGSSKASSIAGKVKSKHQPSEFPRRNSNDFVSNRNRNWSSGQSVYSVTSNASGYFSNCSHDHVMNVLDKIRNKSDTTALIPAMIVDLNEVECMYVEEGCLYLTPKDKNNSSPESHKSSRDKNNLASLFSGLSGNLFSDERRNTDLDEQDYYEEELSPEINASQGLFSRRGSGSISGLSTPDRRKSDTPSFSGYNSPDRRQSDTPQINVAELLTKSK